MPLPVLQPHGDPTGADLLRYYGRAELHWTRQIAEETLLDCGVAFTNKDLPRALDANRMFDVALPEGTTPQQAFEEAGQHFAAAGTRCWSWTMNPAAPPARTAPMTEHLLSRAYARLSNDVMRLSNFPTEPIREVAGLTIIPARASFRHVRAIGEEIARDANAPDAAEALLLHLDDPHTDALLALRDGQAAAYVAVLAVGEIGVIAHLHVAAAFRGQGIGRTMMSRGLEICARSLFRHVFIEVDPANATAMELYRRCGFEKVGDWTIYRAPEAAK
jgi:[ribosomal protein S18]-alanine N-acetyltransferase